MNRSLNCGVGIVLGVEDDVVVINEVIEGGPAHRFLVSNISSFFLLFVFCLIFDCISKRVNIAA